MKKFYLLIFTLSILNSDSFAQFDNCAAADLVPVALPYSGVAETTCGLTNDYDKNNTTICGDPVFMNGPDKVYGFTASSSGSILIMFSSTTPEEDSAGVFVFDGCPNAGGICVASNTLKSPNKTLGVSVIVGRKYYVIIDGGNIDPTNCVTAYSLSITAIDPFCPKLTNATPNFAPNLDFEQGNFNKWTGRTGTCCPVNTPANGIVAGRHTIVSGAGTDPNTGGVVTLVAPGGGKRSARLGNSNTGAQAERLSYTFKVTPQTNGIIYKYAIVLQDPGHAEAEQPRFEVVVKNSAGNAVSCGTYKVTARPDIPCFQAGAGVVYKDWTTVGIDLSPYMGQNITIEYSTGDCSAGGHYGYSYVDVAATKLQIEIVTGDFCNGSDSLVLKAPDGFDGYLWSTGQTTQTITLKNVKPGDSISVSLTPVQGFLCSSTLSIVIPANPTIVADFSSDNNLCESDTFKFNDLSTFTPADANISTWIWSFGDGTTSNTQNPEHIFPSEGTYTVQLIVKNKVGCSDTITKTITVLPALDEPAPLCKNTTTSTVEFEWNAISGATGYEVSLDGGINWITPSSGSTGLTHLVTGLLPDQPVTLLVRSLGPPPCNKSRASEPITCTTGTCSAIIITSFNNDVTINEGEPVTLQVSVTGGDGNYIYTWTPNIGNGPGPHTVYPTENTAYSVTVSSLTDATCPPASDTVNVSVNCNGMSVALILDEDTILQGSSATIYADVVGGHPDQNFSYAWTPNLGTGPGPFTVSPDTTTTYSVVVTDMAAGTSCPTVDDAQTVTVLCNTIKEFVIEGNATVKKGESTTLTAKIKNGGQGPFVYTWTPNIGNGPGPHTVQPDATTTYTVHVDDQGKSGCPPADAEVLVNVYEDPIPEEAFFHLPNAFSPNGDNNNDGFKALGKGITDYHMKIYNRWGEQVFFTRNIDEAWNGFKNNVVGGKRSPVGVYIYVVKVRIQQGKTKTYYGTVSLTDEKE